ncbi:MAG: DUF3037 domain-containing protein [Kiritimatiellae bacterium]|nr:DUF3037 domain-containing protein [Kiritimatiellia bacterium]MDD3544115.1 DUF3037 domain-containing protein [Kiritimatiellia bacterium]MDD4025140.1 DUF3037 domain-containing protein [Kiritimatiellia bacterium]
MIKKLACNYTILRFLPYTEPGEFVNLGVALACPDLHWFGYRLETRRLDRITDFFPELKQNKAAFVEGRKLFKDELDRVAKMMNDGKKNTQLRFKEDAKLFNQVFLNLVRPREEIFCFSPPRTCLTEDPAAEMDRLFDFYVERGFAQRQEYQESLMTKRLRKVFSTEKLLPQLVEYTFSNDFCQAHFPFVRRVGDRYVRAIHPIDLDKTETPKIVEHADSWRNRLQRLKAGPVHPEQVLLVVRRPGAGKQLDVCQQMCTELEQAGAYLLPQEDQTGIVKFAQTA